MIHLSSHKQELVIFVCNIYRWDLIFLSDNDASLFHAHHAMNSVFF